ncbi:MAG: DUF4383 domain-containing protein [Verrucomicrobia bacterium]|nr:DUF4383 domain-containing protein [Verrucomicrobiota bacterium]
MLRNVAKIYGIVFVVIGILGFVPGITYHQHLLGLFHVNAVHNLVHIVTGLVAYAVSRVDTRSCRMFFQIFGVIYAIVGFLGFFYGTKPVLGIIANNMADTWLHLVIGAVSLYFGFWYKKD